MQSVRDERSLGELFADLANQTGALVRAEVAIAKAEVTQTAKQAGRGVGAMVVGGVVVYAGLLAVGAAVILLLARALPDWVAALLVGIVVLALGAFLINWGRSALARTDFAPRQTLSTLAADVDTVKGENR